MKPLTFTLRAKDGTDLFVRKFEPDHFPKKIVLIAHGLAEHSGRYERFANVLNKASAVVYAHDQREHGETGGTFPESDVIDLMLMMCTRFLKKRRVNILIFRCMCSVIVWELSLYDALRKCIKALQEQSFVLQFIY